MKNRDLLRRLIDSVRREIESSAEKGINKPRSTIRHLESAEDGTTSRLLSGLPAYSKEAT